MRFKAAFFRSQILFNLILVGATGSALAQSPSSSAPLPEIVSASSMRQDIRSSGDDTQSIASPVEQVSYLETTSQTPAKDKGAVYQLTGHQKVQSNNYSMSNESCNTCQPCEPSCEPWWAHSNGVFGELLYLSPGNSDLIYAVEQTDTTNSASPTGPVGLTNVDGAVGYRVGFSKRRSLCSSINTSYARWDGDTVTSIDAIGNNVLRSHLVHPSTSTVGFESLSSSARQLINFQLADVSYRRIVRSGEAYVINWSGGLGTAISSKV